MAGCAASAGDPTEPWADKAQCHKRKVAKGSCFLLKAAAGSNSPTTSARQRAKAPAPGEPALKKALAQTRSEVTKLASKIAGSNKELVQENR